MDALRRFGPLLVALVAAACGGTTEPARTSTGDTRSAGSADAVIEAESTGAGGATPGAVVPDGVPQGRRALQRRESLPVEPIEPLVVPEQDVRVHMGRMRLEPRAEFRPPVSPCQDVIVYVREGTLAAVGTGIAGEDAPATLYPGDAVRFGPEGDGRVTNVGEEPARAIVAFTRAAGSGSARPDGADVAAQLGNPPRGEVCRAAEAPAEPHVGSQRMASERTTEPLVIAGGKMRVRILLDADSAGARHGGLAILEGDPDVSVPEHRHEQSAEVLFIEDGEGAMRLGDREVRVRPGVVVYVPPNVLHDYRGAGMRPLRAIQVYAPSGPEQRFRRMAEE